MKKIIFIITAIMAAMTFTVVTGSVTPAGAAAGTCSAWTAPPVGYNGKNMKAVGVCQTGGYNDRYQVWGYCYDGYGGARYQYGNIVTVGGGGVSTTTCYNGAYGAQLVQWGVRVIL